MAMRAHGQGYAAGGTGTEMPQMLGRSKWLVADCQIRRLAAGSADPAGADCDVLILTDLGRFSTGPCVYLDVIRDPYVPFATDGVTPVH